MLSKSNVFFCGHLLILYYFNGSCILLVYAVVVTVTGDPGKTNPHSTSGLSASG